jgi:hypothetical protein
VYSAQYLDGSTSAQDGTFSNEPSRSVSLSPGLQPWLLPTKTKTKNKFLRLFQIMQAVDTTAHRVVMSPQSSHFPEVYVLLSGSRKPSTGKARLILVLLCCCCAPAVPLPHGWAMHASTAAFSERRRFRRRNVELSGSSSRKPALSEKTYLNEVHPTCLFVKPSSETSSLTSPKPVSTSFTMYCLSIRSGRSNGTQPSPTSRRPSDVPPPTPRDVDHASTSDASESISTSSSHEHEHTDFEGPMFVEAQRRRVPRMYRDIDNSEQRRPERRPDNRYLSRSGLHGYSSSCEDSPYGRNDNRNRQQDRNGEERWRSVALSSGLLGDSELDYSIGGGRQWENSPHRDQTQARSFDSDTLADSVANALALVSPAVRTARNPSSSDRSVYPTQQVISSHASDSRKLTQAVEALTHAIQNVHVHVDTVHIHNHPPSPPPANAIMYQVTAPAFLVNIPQPCPSWACPHCSRLGPLIQWCQCLH